MGKDKDILPKQGEIKQTEKHSVSDDRYTYHQEITKVIKADGSSDLYVDKYITRNDKK